jgi:hypothetical protein
MTENLIEKNFESDYKKRVHDRMLVACESREEASKVVDLGLDFADEVKAILIAGSTGGGKTTALNNLLSEHVANGELVMGFRGYPIEGLDQEAVFDNGIDVNTFRICNKYNADVLIFDEIRTDYSEDVLDWPHGKGRKVFYTLHSTGSTPERVKEVAITRFRMMTGLTNIAGIDKIVVTSIDFVNGKKTLVLTDFPITKIR